MEDDKSPPWTPVPDCPSALARSFEDRDSGLLEAELRASTALARGEWFMCRASQVRYHDASSNALFVAGDLARVAISIQWWEGLETIKQAGYPFFDSSGVAHVLWLAIHHGDASAVSRILSGQGRRDRCIRDLPLLVLAGQPRDDSRKQAAQNIVEAFCHQMDVWGPVPCQPMPPGVWGVEVCKQEGSEDKRVSAVVRADPDLISDQLSCVHVLLSENLPQAAAALARAHPLPDTLDQALLLTHWFSGATRHIGASARPSAEALVALAGQGLGLPSMRWMVDRSGTLEDFGLENFNRLMFELVGLLVPSGQWSLEDVAALQDLPLPAIARSPRWLDLLVSMRSAASLHRATVPAAESDQSAHSRI